jgi:uncharacterized delta-60 repeat protein
MEKQKTMVRLRHLRHSLVALFLVRIITNSGSASPGAWDASYSPTVTGGAVNAMLIQPDGKLVLGGAFSSVNNSSSRFHLARLMADGSLDTNFFNTGSGVSSTVWCLGQQTDGRIVIGGDFTAVNGTARTRVARLNINGTLDGSFIPTNAINLSVLAIAPQSDNKVIIGGSFSGGTVPSWNARLNVDGTLDTAFSSFPNGSVNAIAIQTDGKIVVGGAFTTLNGAARNRIGRLNADGSLDNGFQNGLTGASGTVRYLRVQADGKILLGGDFSTVNSTTRNFVARLNSDGSLDSGFNSSAGANSAVYSVIAQTDSTVVIGGSFSTYASGNSSRVARLYPDGTRDTAFSTSGINNIVQAMAIQTDGALLIGGSFTTVSNTSRSFLARLYGNLYPPEFASQPLSRSTNVGATVTFSALVSNPTPSSFQWRRDGFDISGATGTSYTLSNVQFGDAGNYSLFVSNGAGGNTSSNATLQVGIAPAITQQPTSLVVPQGQVATFTVSASGTPLNYFWRKNGAFIPAATNSSLTFGSAVFTNGGTYTCTVSNFLGNVISSSAVLTVSAPPTITVQPIGSTVGVGSNFTLTVSAAGTMPLAYQWIKDDALLSNLTNSTLTVTNAQQVDSGGYAVVITNSFGAVTSAVATVGVFLYAPTIPVQPTGATLVVGSNFTLNVIATGTAPLAYQWRKDGKNLVGANGASYGVASAETNDSGAYTVVVTNVAGNVTSVVAQVSVGFAPVIVVQPEAVTNNLGTSNVFNVIASGSQPLLYQWYKDGVAIPNATNSLLPLPNLQSNQVGYYSVTITNLFGWAGSSNNFLNIPGIAFPALWQGLVAFYPFSGNAGDASPFTNNGTATNCLSSLDRFARANNAYNFDGVDSQIVAPGQNYLNLSSPEFTISVWAKRSNSNPSFLVAKDAGNNRFPNTKWILILGRYHDPGTSTLTFHFVDDAGTLHWVGSSPLIEDTNVWHHYLVTHSGFNYLIFQDGALIESATENGNISFSNPADLTIGGAEGGGWHAGSIDDVRIYNRAMSSNEVAQLYSLEADIPVILQPPESKTVNIGGTVDFTITAAAENPLGFQWFKDGIALAGATDATLTVSNVQPKQIGYYSVIVSNAVTGVESGNVALNVSGYDFSQWHGLVAYYPFTGNASDQSGNGNDGSPNGVVLSTDRFGNSNSCFQFSVGPSYISLTNEGAVEFPADFTVSAWVRFIGGTQSPRIVSTAGYELMTLGTGAHRSFDGNNIFGGGGGVDVQTAPIFPEDVWFHVVYQRDGDRHILYVNGQLQSVNVVPGGTDYSRHFIPLIGANSSDSAFDNFGGRIDDVRFYNRAISSNEVARLYAFEADTPLIIAQPKGLITSQGNAGSFQVIAAAQNPLLFQWNKDGIAIDGATNAVLLLTSIQPSQAGLYTVSISNGLTGVLSAPAALTVIFSDGAGSPGFVSNQFGFSLSGATGSSFVVDTSTNLQSWLPLSTNVFVSGSLQFMDPGSSTNPVRFYRVRY